MRQRIIKRNESSVAPTPRRRPDEELPEGAEPVEELGWDVIVVGAGAAGLMAAGTAARNGKRVLLLEKMDKSGRKVRITGKGRCNVTNARPPEEFAEQIRTNADFFAPAFAELNNKMTIRFFEKRGVKLEIERGDRVFPQSGKAWDIATALLEYCVDNGVKIVYKTQVTGLIAIAGKIYGLRYKNKRHYERQVEAPKIILTTGGCSYPLTGSTGDGYRWAAELGHTIEPLRPSLVALTTSHPQARNLHGVLLKNVRATLYIDSEPVREELGEMSFSERGMEGAVVLRMSRDAMDAFKDKKRVKIVVDLKPGLTEEILRERIQREMEALTPESLFAELLRKLVPKGLVIPLSEETKVHGQTYLKKVTLPEIERLIKTMKGLTFPITGHAGWDYAITTAGGVRVDEVNPETMESRKVSGLYLAGEVLDVDANTGGYNLQIAFSTGKLAGMLKK